MITEETVFILGAGASKPYGYPTGQELSDNIIHTFLGNLRKLNSKTTPHKKAEEFVNIFKRTGESIDLFLSINPEFSDIGKMAIALMILKAERGSQFRSQMTIKDRKQDWYSLLFKRMREGLISSDSYKQFAKNNISFINFNYDRSLEHFLYESIINLYHSQKLEAKLMSNWVSSVEEKDLIPFPFLHVYGKIAEVEWFREGLKYREGFNYQIINKLKDNIKVINYDRQQEDYSEIKKTIRRAKRIFFLGFGFAEENMDILGIPLILKYEPQICGTAFRWTDKEILKITRYLGSSFDKRVSMEKNPNILDKNCYDLLREYL